MEDRTDGATRAFAGIDDALLHIYNNDADLTGQGDVTITCTNAGTESTKAVQAGITTTSSARIIFECTGSARNNGVPGSGTQIVTESGTRPNLDTVAAHYHPATNKIYVYKSDFGATIYTLDVPTDVQNGTYIWSSYTIGGTPPPVGLSNYMHFNIVQDMGDGQGALITNNHWGWATYMHKLPTS